jgi:phosphoglucomutase
MKVVATTPFAGQRPGTSGLRKQTRVFQQPHYLANFVQSVFAVIREQEAADFSQETLVVGGDGRFFNREAIQVILQLAAGNGFGRVLVGCGGILSTPAVSAVIRSRRALGGLILSASHNPGGPEGDFGIKYNTRNGGPAPEAITEAIYAYSQRITTYHVEEGAPIALDQLGEYSLGRTPISVIDPIGDYLAVLQQLFDFDALRRLLKDHFRMVFDAMNAVTGPYATAIFEQLCGAPPGTVMRGQPLEDFGGHHPDPNLIYAKELVDLLYGPQGPDFGAASDGDGDRNLILGRRCFVSPGDSLAVIAEHAQACIPGYRNGLAGVARSMPTSQAADRVARALGVPCYETPTGWKFFGNLMDAGLCTLCGEESFGTGSAHVREKDGLWAVLAWLSIMAATGKSVADLLQQHWARFGRSYFQRHDFEGLDAQRAEQMMAQLRGALPTLRGKLIAGLHVVQADDFAYTDPVTQQVSSHQGIRLIGEDSSRLVCRLSGTGTQGATLRVYAERFEPKQIHQPVEAMLQPQVDGLVALLRLREYCGIDRPSVIT